MNSNNSGGVELALACSAQVRLGCFVTAGLLSYAESCTVRELSFR